VPRYPWHSQKPDGVWRAVLGSGVGEITGDEGSWAPSLRAPRPLLLGRSGYLHHAYKLPLCRTSCSLHQDRLGRGCNGGADPVQRGPDRISVLESRGLLEGLVGEVYAKCGRQNSCNSFVVLNVAYVLFTSRFQIGRRHAVVLRPYFAPRSSLK
jgi:hypothetical protein